MGAIAMSSMATFWRRTSARRRSRGPSKGAGSSGGVIGGLRSGEELVAMGAGGAEEGGELAHEVGAVGVEQLETAGAAGDGAAPGDGLWQIFETAAMRFGGSGGDGELTGGGFGAGGGELLRNVVAAAVEGG